MQGVRDPTQRTEPSSALCEWPKTLFGTQSDRSLQRNHSPVALEALHSARILPRQRRLRSVNHEPKSSCICRIGPFVSDCVWWLSQDAHLLLPSFVSFHVDSNSEVARLTSDSISQELYTSVPAPTGGPPGSLPVNASICKGSISGTYF